MFVVPCLRVFVISKKSSEFVVTPLKVNIKVTKIGMYMTDLIKTSYPKTVYLCETKLFKGALRVY